MPADSGMTNRRTAEGRQMGRKCEVMQPGTKAVSGSCGWQKTVQRHFLVAEPPAKLQVRSPPEGSNHAAYVAIN